MRAIVHIGTEKTGSTSIQEYLYQNRERLAESGFYLIQSAGEKKQRALPAYCLRDDKYDDFFRDQGITTLPQKKEFQRNFLNIFQDEIQSIPKGIHTVIMSSEHFHSRTNTQDEVGNVSELLSSFFSEITIICYLRDQVAMCTSFYSTAIKAGHRPSFEKFVLNCNTKNIYYNYSEMLSNWERSFGLKSLKISVFSPGEFLNGDLLDDFTAKLDPALVGRLDKKIMMANESLSYAGQVLGTAVNSVFPSSAQEVEVIAMRNKCLKIIYDKCKGKGEQPSLDDQRRIYAEFADSNEKVRQQFFPDKPVLFPPVLDEAETNKTIDAGFVDALSGVLDVIIQGQTTNTLPTGRLNRISDSYADILRNAALKFEKEDLMLAFDLMNLAHEIRPAGPFIQKKLEEYRRKLDQ